MNKINIMPIAGSGQRFIDQNFKTPKPLIKILSQYMFIKSSRSFPVSDLTYFIFMKKTYQKYKIKNILNFNYKKKFKVQLINKKTLGQADTCYRVIKKLKSNDEIFISSCDASFKFSKKEFNKLKKDHDMIIFTTKSNSYHHKNPNSFGWVSISSKKTTVSWKKKINKNLRNHNIIIGTFYFKSSNIFKNIFNFLKKNNLKINNEYYVDQMFEIAHIFGYKITSLQVYKFKSYGTPDEI